MTDFLDELCAGSGAVEKDVTYAGKSGPVFFRKISSGERAQMLRGQKVQTKVGDSSTMEIDLSENEQSQQLLVWFSTCTGPEGKRKFKGLEAVKNLDAGVMKALYLAASEVNKEDSDPEKA